jgi:hypothetical protein
MFLGVERSRYVRLTILPPPVSTLSRQCRILNISQRYKPPRPVTRIILPLLFFITDQFLSVSRSHTIPTVDELPLHRPSSAKPSIDSL